MSDESRRRRGGAAFTGERFFLSNFFEGEFLFRPLRVVVKSGEHAFQACKSLDPMERGRVLEAPTPAASKKIGRSRSLITLRSDWEEVKESVMWAVVDCKFDAPGMGELLLSTGDEELVERNYWHDCFFGVYTCSRCGGEGKNVLGKCLMKKRELLKRS